MIRILIVEDEPAILDAVTYTLRGEGFDVDGVDDGDRAVSALRSRDYDLLILDLMLPRRSGTEILRRVRGDGALPVIVLTAKSAETDLVVGLELGADDYVTKPFSMAELVSRVRAILRRRELDRTTAPRVVRAAGIEIDPHQHRVVVDGEPRHLTLSEFRLVSLLASDPGRAFTRREIMEHLWDSRHVGDQRACDIHVSNVRRKLGEGRIETVRGVGYRLSESRAVAGPRRPPRA